MVTHTLDVAVSTPPLALPYIQMVRYVFFNYMTLVVQFTVGVVYVKIYAGVYKCSL